MNLPRATLLFVGVSLVIGCAPIEGVTSKPQPTPAVQTVGVWSAIADRVEAKRIADTDEVLKIVRELRLAGDITDGQADSVDHLGWGDANTTVTDANRSEISAKLRGLK